MSNKTATAILFTALFAVLVALLKETYWAVVVDWVFDQVAVVFGVQRAKMLAAIAPFVIAFVASGVIVGAVYRIGMRERALKPVLAFLYEENNAAYVRPLTGLHGQYGEFYSFGIKNSGHTTLEGLSIRALDGRFTEGVIAGAFLALPEYHRYKRGPVVIFERENLHPDTTEMVQLFGINFNSGVSAKGYVLNEIHQFILEASAKDTPSVRRAFEYNPQSRPMLIMLGPA